MSLHRDGPTRRRVVLAVDQVVYREGLRAVLQERGVAVVGEASDGWEAVRLCEAERPDVAILDVAVPLLNGVDAAREIRRRSPATRTILLAVHADERCVLASLRAGVAGYVLKTCPVADLVRAIETVSLGDTYVSPGVSQTVVRSFLAGAPLPPDPLSGREREVLQLIAEGKDMRTIGSLLGISSRTAETHRARIKEKLAVHDVASLVRYAIKEGLVSAD